MAKHSERQSEKDEREKQDGNAQAQVRQKAGKSKRRKNSGAQLEQPPGESAGAESRMNTGMEVPALGGVSPTTLPLLGEFFSCEWRTMLGAASSAVRHAAGELASVPGLGGLQRLEGLNAPIARSATDVQAAGPEAVSAIRSWLDEAKRSGLAERGGAHIPEFRQLVALLERHEAVSEGGSASLGDADGIQLTNVFRDLNLPAPEELAGSGNNGSAAGAKALPEGLAEALSGLSGIFKENALTAALHRLSAPSSAGQSGQNEVAAALRRALSGLRLSGADASALGRAARSAGASGRGLLDAARPLFEGADGVSRSVQDLLAGLAPGSGQGVEGLSHLAEAFRSVREQRLVGGIAESLRLAPQVLDAPVLTPRPASPAAPNLTIEAVNVQAEARNQEGLIKESITAAFNEYARHIVSQAAQGVRS